jgi:hypothetical protein
VTVDSPLPSRWTRLEDHLLGPVDALPYRVFEVLFTGAFLFRMSRNLVNWKEWLTDWGFHLTAAEYAAMSYPPPAPTLPTWAVPLFAFGVYWFASGILWPISKHRPWWLPIRRLALWGTLVCASYAQAVDYMGSFAYNKIFILTYLLMATGPGPFQQDGRWVIPAAMPRAIQVLLVCLYFAAGYAKGWRGDWLKYDDVLWTHAQGFHRTELAAWFLRMLPKWAWTAMQHSALGFELLAPILFILPRLRWLTIAYGLLFHLMIALLMAGLVFFATQMWSFYAVFVTAAEWRFLWAGCASVLTALAPRITGGELKKR